MGDCCGVCSRYCRGLHCRSKTKTTGKHLLCRCSMPCFIVDVYARCAGSRVWQSDLFYWSLQGKPEKQEPKRRTTKQSDGPTTVQTDRAIFNDIKAGQDGAKQPAGQTTSATGLIAAFRPVEQLPASSAGPEGACDKENAGTSVCLSRSALVLQW